MSPKTMERVTKLREAETQKYANLLEQASRAKPGTEPPPPGWSDRVLDYIRELEAANDIE